MSAWMQGLGLGLDFARNAEARRQADINNQQQERAFEFSREQAGINNAQQDRAFAFNQQQAAINNQQQDRAFDAQEQYRAYMRDQAQREYQDRKDALSREMDARAASVRIFKAINAPKTMPGPGMATGEGEGAYSAPQMPNPAAAISDSDILNASPEARRALFEHAGNQQALAKEREDEMRTVQFARLAGQLKNVSPQQADKWARLGFYQDGTIRGDEMPLSLRKQQQEWADQVAGVLATEFTDSGDLTTNPQVFEQYRNAPIELLNRAFQTKQKFDASYPYWRQRGLDHHTATAYAQREAAGMTIPKPANDGPSASQRATQAAKLMVQAEKEYRALSGQTGKMGTLKPPSDEVIKSADEFAAGTGAFWKWDSTQSAEVAKVTAWRKYLAARSEYANIFNEQPQSGEPQTQQDAPPFEDVMQEFEALQVQ